jgi:hypothetical protein
MLLLRRCQTVRPDRPLPGPAAWECAAFSVRRAEEVGQAAEGLACAMAAAGYPSQVIFSTRRAVEEALAGTAAPGPAAAEVCVGYAVTPLEVRVEIQDPAPAPG